MVVFVLQVAYQILDKYYKDAETGSESCRTVMESGCYADIALDASQACLTRNCKGFFFLALIVIVFGICVGLIRTRCKV